MSEPTGGHYLDTGDGPKALTEAACNVRENEAQGAYRKYLDHRPGCVQCRTSLFICDTAKELWRAYTDARAAAT